MKRWSVIAVFMLCCGISCLGGYLAGCREGWQLGVSAEFLPRGALAAAMLKDLKSNKPDRVATLLEFDVDNALIWSRRFLIIHWART